MDLPEYAGALRRRGLWLAVLALLGLLLAGWSAARSGPTYRSTATLYYGEPDRNLTPAIARVNSFVILATSDQVLDAVRADLGPSLARDDLTDRVHAAIDPETSILTISATDVTPEGARALAALTSLHLIALADSLRTAPGGQSEGRLTLGDPATVAVDISAASATRTVVLGALLGLLIGIVLGLLREATDPRLTHPDQVRRLAPRWPVSCLEPGDELSATAEATARLRELRTAILNAADRPGTLMVTSCEDGDRVPGIADAVALGAARASLNVILVSAHVHPDRPALSRWALAEPGLGAVLLGESRLDTAVTTSPVPGLRLLPAGAARRMPEAPLTSKTMTEVVRDLASRSEILIIDAPPLLAPALHPAAPAHPPDTLGLVRATAAGVLLVVRGGHSRRRALRSVIRLLDTPPGTAVAVVFFSRPARRTAPGPQHPDGAAAAASEHSPSPTVSVIGS